MVSISSSKLIRQRTKEFCDKVKNWIFDRDNKLVNQIYKFIKNEYDIIPKNERVRKGMIYISKYVAKEMVQYLKDHVNNDKNYYINLTNKSFNLGEKHDNIHLQLFALLLLSEYINNFPENIDDIVPLIKKYANHNDWAVRETICFSIISVLRKDPEKILKHINKWIDSDNENLRRLVSESLRPSAQIKWLRISNKNDKVLEILTKLNKDASIYVRKSVGNNIKDLSKYMPEKILVLMEEWIKKSKIKVHDELATEIGLSKEQKRLIWTMKHGMRWIKDRNPEFHSRLEKILGKNYILYYNEKKNKLAKPDLQNY